MDESKEVEQSVFVFRVPHILLTAPEHVGVHEDDITVLVFSGNGHVVVRGTSTKKRFTLKCDTASRSDLVHFWVFAPRKNEDLALVRSRIATGTLAVNLHQNDQTLESVHCNSLDGDHVCIVKAVVDRKRTLWPHVVVARLETPELDKMIQSAEKFWSVHRNGEIEKLSWRRASFPLPSPIGKVPYFAFFYDAPRVCDDTIPALKQLLRVAHIRDQIPVQPHHWTRTQCLAATNCMATVVPLSMAYSIDKDWNKHTVDQWTRIISGMDLSELTYDCEDGTHIALRVLYALKKLNFHKHPKLLAIQTSLVELTPVACICVIKTPGRLLFHCVPLLLPSHVLEAWIKGTQSPPTMSRGLVCEITNNVQPGPHIAVHHKESFHRKTLAGIPLCSSRLSWRSVRHLELYRSVVSIIDPARIRAGQVCQWSVQFSNNTSARPTVFDLLSARETVKFVPVVKKPLTTKVIAELDRIELELPQCTLLPPVSASAEKSELFAKLRVDYTSPDAPDVYYCRPSDFENSVHADIQHTLMLTRAKKKPTIAWATFDVVDGLKSTKIVIS